MQSSLSGRAVKALDLRSDDIGVLLMMMVEQRRVNAKREGQHAGMSAANVGAKYC